MFFCDPFVGSIVGKSAEFEANSSVRKIYTIEKRGIRDESGWVKGSIYFKI